MIVTCDKIAAIKPTVSPVSQPEQYWCECPAFVGNRIFYLGRDDREYLPFHEPIIFKLPKLFDEKPLRAVAKLSLQRVEAQGPLQQVVKDHALPLAANEVECRVHRAAGHLIVVPIFVHLDFHDGILLDTMCL